MCSISLDALFPMLYNGYIQLPHSDPTRKGDAHMADRVGQQLGNYRLTRFLGRGGFAKVYLGEHIHLYTQAAIKVLHNQLTSEDVEQFRTEARTLARLVHPQIVRVLDFLLLKAPFLFLSWITLPKVRCASAIPGVQHCH